MPENPYKPPKVAPGIDRPTVDRSAFVLWFVLALQILWIALIGAMAKGYVSESYIVLMYAVPIMLLGLPALVLWLAGNLSRSMFIALVGIELVLFAIHLLALLPAVQ
jgi:hypothetical protein